jgi:glycosyltransferase involved in cell wall biosynthesis
MKVSIVIPVYNKAEYISNCLESLLQQDFDDFEIIVVDDGSTDDSGRICDEKSAQDSRIRVIHTENGGVTSARRKGVEHAAGEYIMFVDADDSLLTGAITTLYNAITENGADEVIGTYKDQHGNCYDSGWRGFVPCEPLIRNLLSIKNSFCVLWGIMFRKKLLDGCLDAPREIVEREDSLMQIKCLIKNPKVFFIADAVYLYNVDVPNNRIENLEWIRIYDNELRKTLQSQWELYKSAFVGHQIKVYEKFIDKRQFYVLNDYYRPLRKQLTSDIPLMDRVVIMLPPQLGYFPIHYYKKLLKLKQSIANK